MVISIDYNQYHIYNLYVHFDLVYEDGKIRMLRLLLCKSGILYNYRMLLTMSFVLFPRARDSCVVGTMGVDDGWFYYTSGFSMV